MRLALYVLAAALCTGTGLIIPVLWPLVLAGVALFLHLQWTKTTRLLSALLHSTLYASIVSGFSVLWFFDAHPLDWLSLGSDGESFLILLSTWIATTAALSIGPSLLGTVLWLVRASEYRIFLSALMFVIAEELRMWGFAVLTYGPSSLFGPHLSVGSLGYALSESPHLLQLADYGGVQALTFFAVLIAGTIALLARGVRTRIETIGILLVIGSSTILPFVYVSAMPENTREPLTVALLNTNEAIGSPPPTQEHTEALLEKALSYAPDIVVFPEQYRASRIITERTVTSGEDEVMVVSADHTPIHSGSYTVDLVFDSTTRGRVATHHKEFLMALGEYAPVAATPLYAPFANSRIHGYLASVRAVQPSDASITVVPFKSWVLGGLLCSETLSPHLYKRLANAGATVLINAANPSWFRGSRMLHEKLLQVARVHAVENRAYFLQANNELPSFALSPTGALLAVSSGSTEDVVSVSIR